MSVVRIPKPVGTVTVDKCPECSQVHADALAFDRGDGPYIICRRTIRSVSLAGVAITPLEEEIEITDWVPQGLAIGAAADTACGMGGEISRLKKQVKALQAAPAAPFPIVESAAGGENPLAVVQEVLADWLEDIGVCEQPIDEVEAGSFFGMLGTAGYSIVPNALAARAAAASIEGGAAGEVPAPERGFYFVTTADEEEVLSYCDGTAWYFPDGFPVSAMVTAHETAEIDHQRKASILRNVRELKGRRKSGPTISSGDSTTVFTSAEQTGQVIAPCGFAGFCAPTQSGHCANCPMPSAAATPVGEEAGGAPIMTAEACLAEVRERLLNHSDAEHAHLIAVDLPELISLVIGPVPQPVGPVSLTTEPDLNELPF